MQDCNKALRAFGILYELNGGMIPGLANRRGHRNVAEGRNTAGWGGIRVKKLLIAEVVRWLHADAVSAKIVEQQILLCSLLKSIIIRLMRIFQMMSKLFGICLCDTFNLYCKK